jgi:hypothetical protein
MSREDLINSTVKKIKHLSDFKLQEVSDFVSFLESKIEDELITEGIKKMMSTSKTYKFLNEEEELYQLNDLKEVYK